jgi:hypothetical protein
VNVRDNTINPARIARVIVSLEGSKGNPSVTVQAIEPFGTNVPGPVPFFPFIDKYGQYKHADWPGKVYGDEDLIAAMKKDQADLAANKGPSGWSKYGGWADGPKQEVTGFFHPKKVDGKWWLVDPEGHLFWSYGPTGVNAGGEGGPITDKESWFEELPSQDGEFAKYWSSGKGARFRYYQDGKPWKGFSFSALNAHKKYGPDWREATADALHGRLRNWGFNTIANWSDATVYLKHKTPYAVALHPAPLSLDHMPDVFDESFGRLVTERMEKERGRSVDDPWCIGYFVDNELTWGAAPRAARVVDGIMKAAATQPAKKAFLADLQAKYTDVTALNAAWKTKYESWDAFMESRTALDKPNDAYKQDAGDFAMKFTERYFSTVRDAVKKVAPNNLYLGCRFNGHIDASIIKVAAKYCDVISYNIYETPNGRLNQYRNVVDKPFIVGEFGVGSDFAQSPWRGADNQKKDRLESMRSWLTEAMVNPSLVGAHFFQFRDQALQGRPDGEAQLRGFINVTDTPHFDLVELNREFGYPLYTIRSTGKFPE